MKIKRVTHPDALSISRTWMDEAIVTGQPRVEYPFWYENIDTGQMYYDLYGCIGWPSEVSDKDEGMPGYVAIIGVVKPKTQIKVQDALFILLAEKESRDVPTLLSHLLDIRNEYGFGLFPGFLQTFLGDPDRFITSLALLNERLTIDHQHKNAILVSPPNDYYEPKAFDHYVRSLRSTMMPDKVRFYFGKNDILKNKLKGFKRDDPAVYAVGGLIHSLLAQCTWMGFARENMFNVLEEGDNDD